MVSGQLLKMFKVQPARVLPEFLLEGAPALFFYRFFAFEEDKVGRPTAVLEVHAVVHFLHEFHLVTCLCHAAIGCFCPVAGEFCLCVDPSLALLRPRYLECNLLQ